MKELFQFYLKIGASGFGGPIALIGMMEDYWVRKTQRISLSQFQQYVSTAKLFPGTIAPLVAIRIGYELAGRAGGTIAGLCLILPAFFMILTLSQLVPFLQSDSRPLLQVAFNGLNLGGLALSVVAAIRFSLPLFERNSLLYLFGAGILTFFFPQQEIYFLLACGFLALVMHHFKNHLFDAGSTILFLLFAESLKASLFTFGSGIAIVPVLKSVYIDQYHWITETDFLTGLSLGQMTPGPLVILNTYLAKLVGGYSGALLASIGTFLPPFIFGLWIMPIFEKRILNSKGFTIFFSGVLPAVGGAILGSVLRLVLFATQKAGSGISLTQTALLAVLVGFGFQKRFHPILTMFFGSMLAILGFLLEARQ